MIARIVLFSLSILVPAIASAAAHEGPEGLCAKVARAAGPALEKAPSFALQISAEGAALDLADGVRAWCELALTTDARPASATSEDVVRLRLRVSGATLLAALDVLHARKPVLTEAVEAPLGAALASWTAAGGTGLETWLAGSMEGEVLALCGGDPDRDGVADLLLFTGDSITWVRWTASALELQGSVPVPPKARPRARVPMAFASCFDVEDGLGASFAVPDRNVTGGVSLRGGVLEWRGEVAGLQLARFHVGTVEATGRAGQPLFTWGRDPLPWAAFAAGPGTREGDVTVVLATQDGRAYWAVDQAIGALPGKLDGRDAMRRLGTGLALADLDGDAAPELIATRWALPSTDAKDRLTAYVPGTFAVRAESSEITGLFGTLGLVDVAGWQRVVGTQRSGPRTNLFAFGRRRPEAR